MSPARIACVAVTLALSCPASAERLSVRLFTQNDGLADDHVRCLLQDSRGYLWVGTSSGLSRFDGERWVNYGAEDGLPHPEVTALAEDSGGRLWAGTAAGLALMSESRAADGRLFREFSFGDDPAANAVRVLHRDRAGRLLIGVGPALMCLRPGAGEPAFERIEIGPVEAPGARNEVQGIEEGADGSLWFAAARGFVRWQPDGRWIRYPLSPPATSNALRVMADRTGRVWAAGTGTTVFVPDRAGPHAGLPLYRAPAAADPARLPLPRIPGEAISLAMMPPAGYGDLIETRDGSVWIATTSGAFVVRGSTIRRLSEVDGLAGDSMTALLEDACGSVWIGTEARGLMRLGGRALSSYTRADGLATESVASVMPDGTGGIFAIGVPASSFIHVLRGERFAAIRIPIPRDVVFPGWGWNQVTLRDSRGEWWVPTSQGLFRFARVARIEDLAGAEPVARYGADSSLAADKIFRTFEDSRGDIWVGAFGKTLVARWDHATGRFVPYGPASGAPADAATAFAEDADGVMWIGFYRGSLARAREQRFETFDAAEGVPPGLITALFFDSSHRLWVGSTRGAARADDPRAPRPRFQRVAVGSGALSSGAYCFAEDRWGRIYVGTLRGIERLDPATGLTGHFDTSNGLVNNGVISATRGDNDELWFATQGGVSRLRPELETAAPPPRLVITNVLVGGVPVSVPELGTTEAAPLRLPAARGEVEIGFGAIDLVSGPAPRFQVALGLRDADWRPPSVERRIHLLGLAPGSYQLRLRAVRSDGALSGVARVAFVVEPPIWRTWWFMTTAGVVLAAAAAAVGRARLRRLAAMRAVRERIARDLHDELGLSLTRITMLSEVVKRRLGERGAPEAREVGEIGATAVELMDATSDMAWALDPARDTLESLLARLRRLASDVFDSSGVAWTFTAPEDTTSIALPADARRQVYLILKEAIHNAARHSRASRVEMEVKDDGGWLVARVCDDGCGFEPRSGPGGEGIEGGRGLPGMRRRGLELGGEVVVRSASGAGTEVLVRVKVVR